MSDPWHLIRLRKGGTTLAFLPGIGGRLWDVEIFGQSLLFQNPDLAGIDLQNTPIGDLPTRSPQFGFPLWGGEKTWIAPDTAWANGAPHPVLDSGAYAVTSVTNTEVEMASAICPLSHLSITRLISLISETSWTIAHSVTNHGEETRPTGVWSVMMLDTPAAIGIAMETATYDPVFGSADGILTTQPKGTAAMCTRKQEFKIGLPNPDGTTFIRCGQGGPWLTCSVPAAQAQSKYAHHHPVEIFNSGDYAYCEAEWHSPMCDLEPGETMHFKQMFEVFSDIQAADGLNRHEELVSCMS